MTHVKTKRLPTDLSPEDWIQAGFAALTKCGPSGVKIDRIATSLKISRGSFYWHFKSAKDLKQAMIEHWVRVGTDDVIALAEGHELSPLDKFIALGQRINGPRDLKYGGILAETAIRDWGRYDEAVGKAVETVTRRRIAYIGSIFEELGFTASDAQTRANLLYSTMIGLEFLNAIDLSLMDAELTALMHMLLQTSPPNTN